jgi:hypothetical protein
MEVITEGVNKIDVAGVVFILLSQEKMLELDQPPIPLGTIVATVNVSVSGVGSILPAGSIERIRTVCAHSARFTYDTGDIHPV